ncbi:neutral/alkaline non-lysosomal ceramidase N-terminal domain-containing protein [Gimesia maris]|uniref:neutral/alkaline non-lysosomal ceramidase N-terminal domain-containing protein n=1 Tax=Gimesia maris TaxID=122 RepID=UPI0032ECE636
MRIQCALIFTILCLAFVLSGFANTAMSDEPTFQAGAVMSNITPPIGSNQTGRSSKRQATHVHDELHARCLVLDDGQSKLALVVCDLRHISAEVVVNAKQIIQQSTGIPPECVLVSATHTHTSSGAKLEDREGQSYYDYRAFLTRRIADGVQRAVNQLQPARIGWGVAEEPTQVFNRRWFLMPSRGTIYGAHDNIEQVDTNPGYSGLLRPAGPVDPQITFLAVQSTAGKPIALLASYGLHYVGGVPANTISADYFAIFADRVGELLGADRHQDPPFVGIMANGTSGDVNNLARYSEEELKKRGPQPKKRYQPFEKAREVAHLCAEKVMQEHKTLKWHDHVKLSSVQRTLTFERRYPTAEEVTWAEAVKAKKIKPMSTSRYSTYRTVLAYASPEMPPTIDVIVQTHRIGDLAVAAMPFEVFAEIGLELKQRSPIQPLMNISIANGSHGYLPTPGQHRLGGYETWIGVNKVQLDASEKMVDALVEMLSGLNATGR